MKMMNLKFLAFVTAFASVMLLFPYWGNLMISSGQREKVVIVDKGNIEKTTIAIEGMTCKACEATVEKVGGEIDGVITIKASTTDKKVYLEFDKTKTDINSIMKAIATTGYKPVDYKSESLQEKKLHKYK